MIITVNKAILHILDALSGVSVFSEKELDVSDGNITAYITAHIEKVFDDSSLRSGEFNSSSGFKYHLTEYLSGAEDFVRFSVYAAERLYEAISSSEKIYSADLMVCECTVREKNYICILKFDNKPGFTHRVVQEEGTVCNEIINHYAILPSSGQKISDAAFIDTETLALRCKGKKISVDGEKADLMGEFLLDGIFDISPRESYRAAVKIARDVAREFGADEAEVSVRMKDYIKEAVASDSDLEPEKAAEAMFSESPSMREAFFDRAMEKQIPEHVEITEDIAKQASSNIRLVTDSGIELSLPAEFYRDPERMSLINNDDGTLSIQLNNIGSITAK